MVLFCAVVERNSFSEAAKRLGHTPSHVSKEIARLEARLGTRLLNRTTRKISLTESGRVYYDNARRIVGDAQLIEDHIQTLGDRPFGELKMSVPVIFAHGCLNRWLPEFMGLYPDVTLDIEVSDRKADLIAEGIDLVVRIGDLPSSDLIARELFQTELPTVASPDYLKAYGTPRHPQDLAGHQLIDFSYRDVAHSWSFPNPDGGLVTVGIDPRVRCNSAEMEKALALAGCGITRLPKLAYHREYEAGFLVKLLEEFEPKPAGVHLVYASKESLPPKTRAMADFLIKKTSEEMKNP